MPVAAGTVLELHRWPVKSLAGEPVDRLRVDGRGVGGDRTHAVIHVHKGQPRRLTAREAPRLLAWRASYAGADVRPDEPPAPVLTAPDGRSFGWDDEALPAALAADLGREVTLRRDVAGQQDLRDSVLITVQATLDALEAEMGQPVDLRRFRTNVHVELDAEPFAEEGWEGRRVRIGDAELEVLH
ncbi:MAG TPA: MOSC N-terminal beta barrel domain-containing protein, partial [Capillimicrobium sp.]|nr:MOSC N-terminal beta barrel domain-containing protein [Capillimicrobium sp.]